MSSDKKLLTEWTAFSYTPEMVKESRDRNGGKVIMKGILQKAETLNQNGRVYPLSILEREVRNYQKFIRENRALGECVPPGTEILTLSGWKKIENIDDNEIIATCNLSTGETEYQAIDQKIEIQFSGKLHKIHNHSTYNMVVTPNHNHVLWDRKNIPYKISSTELLDIARGTNKTKRSWISHSAFKRAFTNWKGEDPETFLIDGKEIDSQLWAAFLGIYLAEGHSSGVYKSYRQAYHNVVITQNSGETANKIMNLMQQLPWNFTTKESLEKRFDFCIRNSELHSHLVQLGGSREKFIPDYAKNWSPRLLSILLEWMLYGDSLHRKNGAIEYATSSRRLANDVQEVMLKLGHASTIRVRKPYERISPDPGQVILAENQSDMHIVYMHTSNAVSSDLRFMKIDEIEYDGPVYCVNVKNGTWLMRQNERVAWTGNCDHPDSSVVELKKVSHIIREAWMEGNVCYGTVEILDTPMGKILQSLIESGVTLGISSRGVGSTKRDGDSQVVQDDFQLICWDFVAEPSTPGAFMMAEGKRVSENDLKKTFTRSDRIDRVFNEVLSWRKSDKR